MVNTVKFAGFLWLLFTVLAQGHSTEYIKQHGKTTIDGFTGSTTWNFDQEFLDGDVSTKTVVSNKIRLQQGRKMLVENDLKKEMMKDEGVVLNGVSSMKSSDAGKGKITSKSVGASLSQHKLNDDQNQSNMLKPRSESVDLQNTNQLINSLESKANSACSSLEAGSHEDPSQRFEPKKLPPAATNDQFMNMMHKDYKGYDKPRRKPPINNYEPLGVEYTGPNNKPAPRLVPNHNYEPHLDVDYTPPHKPPRMNSNHLLDADYSRPRGGQPKPPTFNNNDFLDTDYRPIPGGHAKPPVINNNELLDDYSKPAPKPRRKPPINNHEPLDHEDNNVKP